MNKRGIIILGKVVKLNSFKMMLRAAMNTTKNEARKTKLEKCVGCIVLNK